MVNLQTVRANNAALKQLTPGLVAVFVGGTSGIGFSTAREFVRNTTSPHVYLIGRNQTEASRIIQELQTINPSSQLSFIKSDLSLLRNVDTACEEIKAKESKVNLLFMSAGYLTTQGRNETEEGLDKKFSLHYYSRMRFAVNLLPLLNSASQQNQLSRVFSVLDAAVHGTGLNLDDLSLKNNFTLGNCAFHACAMTNLALERFAEKYPGTSFIHEAPGGVKTNIGRELSTVMRAGMSVAAFFLSPFLMVPFQESGERHVFASTSKMYAPRAAEESAAVGSLGTKGSGAYWLNWDGENVGKDTFRKMGELREKGAREKIWEHTEEVFEKICGERGKY